MVRFMTVTLLLFVSSVAHAQSFRAGAAKSNITPPLGGPIVGGFVPFPATHVHDELHARCLVLDDGKTKLAFVVCDLLGIDRLVSDEARAIIEQDLKIPKENVLISATHTHSACSALGKDARIIGDTMDDYQRFVARRIVDGVKRAHNLLRPAWIGFGSVQVPEQVFNRRWHMKPGSIPPNPFGGMDKVKMNPPAGSPDLLEPAGPTDPEVAFIVLREAPPEKSTDRRPGKYIGIFATYSLHYVGGVGSGHISADYYGMFCDMLEKKFKDEINMTVVMMANGTSGDINNINFRKARPKQEPYAQMGLVAGEVANPIRVLLEDEKLKFREHVTLAARYQELPVATRRPDAELLTWAKTLLKDRPKSKKADMPAIYAERTLRMAEHPEKLKMPLQVLRVGDVAIGSMPCEIFCEIGLEFKKKSAIKPAWLVSLNHGYYGYLPTPKHHELGGYETWLGTNRLEKQASEKMLAALVDMTKELKSK